ncbi:hypothetical protein ASE67_11350 [Sphingomonas sp. Leaf23]|uniref:hypothetical protein n=1 Tax=Sphingomonas sp. Leaf23 TaxID=1735689 RepID=UPI0006F3A2AA|nr:hypothetical protein [Sphingomonas sp. Leaf23]KQM86408.1 hypothetical protein ASE67_11350 [Sphingomonas sp. Leaf23]
MRRVALFLDLIDDEADLVIAAVSETPVRFAGLTLAEVVQLSISDAPSGTPDMTIAHDVRSDGALYAGDPKFHLVRRP